MGSRVKRKIPKKTVKTTIPFGNHIDPQPVYGFMWAKGPFGYAMKIALSFEVDPKFSAKELDQFSGAYYSLYRTVERVARARKRKVSKRRA